MDPNTDSSNEMNVNEQRKKWIRFDDGEPNETDLSVKDSHNSDTPNPVVLSVDSSPHLPVAQKDEHNAAVIDTTQVHVTMEKKRRTPDVVSFPVPAPRTVPPPMVQRSHSTPSGPVFPNRNSVNSDRISETVMQIESLQPSSRVPNARTRGAQRLQNVPLQDVVNGASSRGSTIRQDSFALRQGFANGDVIVTLYPTNNKCAWLTPAKFRPELIPEELMAEGLTLTIEEYVSALEVLVNDFRFNCYNMCYKRILLFWILFGFIVLLALLFSGIRGLGLFGGGVVWLFLNATGIFVSMWLKMKMSHHLERCLAIVNKHFLKHKILIGLDDKGKLSCHKVNLIFIYFDCDDCINKLNEIIDLYDKEPKDEQNSRSRPRANIQSRMDIDTSDIIITGNSNTRVSRKQIRAEKLLLRYSQRWVKEYSRHRLDLTVDVHDRNDGEPPAAPRHCVHARCPCQFIEEHLKYKPRGCQACLDVASIPTILAPSYL